VSVVSVIRLSTLLAAGMVSAAPGSLSFEDAVRLSDRIIIGTVQAAGAGSVRVGDSKDIVLGVKDSSTGLVFTPYRVRIDQCLFDNDGSCSPGDTEVLIPGGTVYETVNGEERLRTWEVAGAAGAPLPPAGDAVLLFLSKRNGRYLPLNDSGARIAVAESLGTASVTLRFTSPRFLSDAGRDAARARLAAGRQATTPPVFVESVQLGRLKSLIQLARQVLTPTSGLRHAIPGRADVDDARLIRSRCPCVRTG
jgi:hypothetical protein